MQLDKDTLLTGTVAAPAQTLTSTAQSTNVIDQQATRSLNRGEQLELVVQVAVAYNAAGTLKASVRSDGSNRPSTILAEGPAWTLAQGLNTIGKQFRLPLTMVPGNTGEFLDANFTIAGSPTQGAVIAWIARAGTTSHDAPVGGY